MKFTKATDLLAIALLGGLVTHIALRFVYATLPPIPRLAATPLVLLAIIEVIMAVQLRARINRRPDTDARPVQPLFAARAVALAKASSVVGSALFGAWVGMIIYLAPQANSVTAAGADLITALIGAACTAALIAAALWLEYCCKTPNQPKDPDRA